MGSVVISTTIALVLWGNFAFRQWRFRGHPRDAVQRGTSSALGWMALTFTILNPPVYLTIDAITGVPNVARLLANCTGVLSAWSFAPVATEVSRSTSRFTRFAGSASLLVLTLAAMVALFVIADTRVSETIDFTSRYGAIPAVIAYRFVFLGYIGLTMCRLFVLWQQRLAPLTSAVTNRLLRLQVQLQTVGWAMGAIYCAHECGFIALRLIGIAPANAFSPVIVYTLLIGIFATILSGSAFALWEWLDRHRTYRQLAPLWRDLAAITPGIVLESARTLHDGLDALLDTDFRLYRRVTEIRDGVMSLQPYLERRLVTNALNADDAPSGDTDRSAATEATLVALRAGMVAKQRGRRATAPITRPLLRNHTDLREETRYLRGLAIAYARDAAKRGETKRTVHVGESAQARRRKETTP